TGVQTCALPILAEKRHFADTGTLCDLHSGRRRITMFNKQLHRCLLEFTMSLLPTRHTQMLVTNISWSNPVAPTALGNFFGYMPMFYPHKVSRAYAGILRERRGRADWVGLSSHCEQRGLV